MLSTKVLRKLFDVFGIDAGFASPGGGNNKDGTAWMPSIPCFGNCSILDLSDF